MGNQRQYIPEGGFSEYTYEDVTEKITINDITSKIIKIIGNNDDSPKSLPLYSNTSDMYFIQNSTGEVIQSRLYIGRNAFMDFDWDHEHKNNKKGEVFPIGTVHVQYFEIQKDGSLKRMYKKARYMTQEEIDKYGPIITHYNPNVKFRP